MQQKVRIGIALTDDEVPEIRIMMIVDNEVVVDQEMTAVIMSVVAQKVFAQDGKCFGRLVNTDGSLGDLVKFKASKVEVH